MTGPVERVPLTDEQLDRIEYMARFPARWRESLSNAAPHLVAELRASRAREQELQQRIDNLLATCEAADTDLTPRLMYVQLLDPRSVRAALTGTEASDGAAGR